MVIQINWSYVVQFSNTTWKVRSAILPDECLFWLNLEHFVSSYWLGVEGDVSLNSICSEYGDKQHEGFWMLSDYSFHHPSSLIVRHQADGSCGPKISRETQVALPGHRRRGSCFTPIKRRKLFYWLAQYYCSDHKWLSGLLDGVCTILYCFHFKARKRMHSPGLL